jgi:hypothetical protein
MPHASRIALLLAALVCLAATTVSAQTPAATVQDGSGNVRLQSFVNGQLLAPGPFDAGATIPATGIGTRLMWWPEKAALRAGTVGSFGDGSQWDPANIGIHSVAFGSDTKANGAGAMAMGDGTIAADPHSLSVGSYNSSNTVQDGGLPSDDFLFVVGNGGPPSFTPGGRSDALALRGDGDLEISGTLTESSDRRLKEEIRPLGQDVLRKLSRLRPVRFEFKDQRTHPSGELIGLVAQDVRKEFPQLVSKGSDGMLSLAYPKMTTVLLKGIQEQQTQLEKKNEQIAKLRADQRQIQERLAALEAEEPPVAAGWVGGGLLRAFGLLLIGGLLGGVLVAWLLPDRLLPARS